VLNYLGGTIMFRSISTAAVVLLSMLAAACNPAAVSTRDISTELAVAYPIDDGSYKAVGETSGDALQVTRSEADKGYRLPIPDAKTKDTQILVVRFLKLPELPDNTYLMQLPDPEKHNYAYYFVSASNGVVAILEPPFAALANAPAAGGPPANIAGAVRVPGADGAAVDIVDPAKTADVLKAVTQLGWPSVMMILARQ
jgi:hypothetical protein